MRVFSPFVQTNGKFSIIWRLYYKHGFTSGAGSYRIWMWNDIWPKQLGAPIATVQLHLPNGQMLFLHKTPSLKHMSNFWLFISLSTPSFWNTGHHNRLDFCCLFVCLLAIIFYFCLHELILWTILNVMSDALQITDRPFLTLLSRTANQGHHMQNLLALLWKDTVVRIRQAMLR